jgi:hypothetical protein
MLEAGRASSEIASARRAKISLLAIFAAGSSLCKARPRRLGIDYDVATFG